jgi:hypothetical protein
LSKTFTSARRGRGYAKRSRRAGALSSSCLAKTTSLPSGNRIYRGEIVHKRQSYPGEHEAIIDEPLWNNVQAILCGNRVDRVHGRTGHAPSLLTGMLFDAHGGRMSPTHATKKGTRYRYYISRSLLDGSTKARTEGQRILAVVLESLVVRRIRDWLADPASRRSSSRFAANSTLKKLTPVRLLPGRARLATRPSLTGSSETDDGNRRGCHLGRQRRRVTSGRSDHGDWTAHQFDRHRR